MSRKRKSRAQEKRPALVEELEQRLLFSADVAALPIDPLAPGEAEAPAAIVLDVGTTGTEVSETPPAELTSLPLAFEENVGQTDPEVDFLARGSGFGVFLADGDAVLSLRGEDGAHVVRLALQGAAEEPAARGVDALESESHYLLGAQEGHLTGVSHYGAVEYADVYDGIDVRYYGHGRQLEYDFIVQAGADPDAIRLAFEGAEALAIAENGDLVVTLNGAGEAIRFQAPVSYQEGAAGRESVASAYVLHEDGSVGFELGAYDASRTLVIDPILDYGTYLGGTGTDVANGVAVDAAGNAYVVGDTTSAAFPTTVGPIGPNNAQDVFVSKLSADGSSLVFSTYIGGGSADNGKGIAVDAGGNVYVTGNAYSTDFPTTASAFDGSGDGSGSNSDAFFLKLDPTGTSLLYSTYFGGDGDDAGNAIAIDAAGNAYLTGSASDASGFTLTGGVVDTSFGGGYEAYVAKFDPTQSGGASLVYSTWLGGAVGSTGNDVGNGIAVDASGRAHVTGFTVANDFPTTAGAYQTGPAAGSHDAFVSVLDASASSLVYSTYLGGSSSDMGNAIALDAAGLIYITGETDSLLGANFPTTVGAYQTTHGTGTNDDAFVAVLDRTQSGAASLVYSTYLGGNASDQGEAIAVDSAGKVYVTGRTASSNFATSGDALDATLGGSSDAFVTVLDPAGGGAADLVYSSYLGGATSSETGHGLTLDANDDVYVVGRTASSDFSTTAGAFDQIANGGTDGFVAKFTGLANTAPVAADDAYGLDEDTTLSVGWWDTDWTRRQTLTFNNSGQAQDLDEFPVLVVLNSGNVAYGQIQDQGQDLRFFDANGTPLAYEIEKWNESGDSFVWVRVPRIDASSTTDSITMYYGNATAAAGQDQNATWASEYSAVYHLNEDPTTTGGVIDESTTSSLDGVNQGSVDAAGRVGNAQSFDGINDYIDLIGGSFVDDASHVTISAWLNPDTITGNEQLASVSVGGAGPTANSRVGIERTSDELKVYARSSDGEGQQLVTTTSLNLTPGAWRHVTGVVDYAADTILIYVDGVLQATTGTVSFSNPTASSGPSANASIGAQDDGSTNFFTGDLDEVRIQTTARSVEWIRAQHLSMMNASFVSFGGAETAPATQGAAGNDSDPNDDSVTATLVAGPSNADSFSFNPDGTFAYTPTAGWSGIDSFTYKLNDGTSDSNVATVTLTVNAINDAPTVGGTVAGQAVTDKTTVDPFSGVTIGDVDLPAQTLTVDVQVDLAAKGALTNLGSFTDLGGGLYRFSGTAAAASTAIQALTFDPAENRVTPGSTETTTFTISVDDGVAPPTVDATTTVISTSVNDASTLGGTAVGQPVTDKTTVDPFSGVTVGDVDNPAQTLTVDIQLDVAAKGLLTNLSGFTDLGGGLYRFSGTAAAATTAIQALTFDPAENRVTPGSTETTTFTISVDDGIAAPTVDATTTVISTSVNDASSVAGTVAGQAVTDKTTVDPFSGVTVGDVDNPAQTLTVDVQLDVAAKGLLTNLSGFTDLGGGLYRFSGTAAAATTAIQALTFDPAENRVEPGSTETTTFTISIDDGIAAPTVDATTTVISTSVNDASSVAGTVAGQAVTDKTTVDPFSGVTIGDVDNPAQTLTVDVQLDAAAKGALTNLSGFTDLGSGLYRFSGTAAAATTAIQALTFDPAENRVTPGSTETTTFTISIDDGIAAPTVDATTTVISTSVNDASTLGGTVAGQAVTDKTTVDPFSGVAIGDVDNPAQTLTVDVQLDVAAKGVLTNLSGFTDLGAGLYRFSGTAAAATTAIQALTFDPAENRVTPGSTETTTFTISVDDGIAAPTVDATTTVISTSVNDASSVAGTVAGQAVTDKTTVDPFSGVTIGDADNPAQTLTVDVQLDLAAKGVLTNLSGFTDLGGGLYRFSGTAAAATTAIQALTFDPAENRVAPGSTETTTFTISIDDGIAAPTVDATTTVISTSLNDASTVAGTVASQPVTDKTTVDPFSGVTIGDVDNPAQTLTVDVQLDVAAKGVLANLSGFTDLGGGLYRFSGTAAAATTAIQALTFDPAENRVAPGSTETTTFTISVDDGIAAPTVDATTTVISTSLNDASTVGGTVAGQAVTDKTTVDPFSGVTIGDVDNPAQSLTVDVQLDLAAKGVLANLSGFTDLGGGLYSFSGTAAAATTAIQALTFDPAENRVTPGSTETTTFTISVDDGIAAPTVDATTTVISTSVNDASSVAGTVAGQAVTDKATVDPFSGVTIGDADNPAQTLTVDVQLDLAAKGTLTNLSGFTDLGGGLYRFSGTAAAATTAIQGLTFDPAENRVAPGLTETTTFTITVDDGIAAPAVDAASTVITTSINDAPSLNNGTLAAVPESTPNPPGATVATIFAGQFGDVDASSAFAGIAVVGNGANPGTEGTWEYSTNAGTNWFAIGSVADGLSALAIDSATLVRFVPVPGYNGSPTALIVRALDDTYAGAFSTTAGSETRETVDTSSPGASTPISDPTAELQTSITFVNDAPTLVGAVAGQAVTDKTTVDPFTGVTIGDVDTPAQTLTVDVQLDLAAKGVLTNLSGFTDLGGGLYRFSGTAAAATTAIQALTFDPAENRVTPGSTETTTFTISVDDGIATPTVDATTTVISTSVNDASSVAGTVAGQAVTDKTTVDPFGGVTIGDADNPAQTLIVDVQLDLAAKGTLINLSGFADLGGGLYRFSGTAAAATTAIQALTFDPAENRVTPGLTETTTFTVTVDDGIAAPTVDGTTTVISTSVNDASSVAGTVAGQAVTDKTTVDPFSGVTIGDVDNPAQTLIVDVQLDLAAKGVLTNLSGFTDLGSGLYRFSGTAAAATAAIQALTFDPTENRVTPGLTETTTFTISVDDGIAAPSVDGTTTVISTSVNDASSVAGTVAGQAVTDKTTVDPFSGVTIGDVDNPAQTLIVDVQLDLAAKGTLINLSGFADLGGGLYRFSGTAAAATTAIQALTFDPAENRVAPGLTETTTFAVTVDDGIAAPTVDGTTTVISTSVNDASSVAGAAAGQAVTDKTTVDPFSGVTIGDLDNPAQSLTVDVQLDLAAKGVLTNLSGFSDLGGGLYRFSGTAAAATTAIQALTFDPAENRVAPGLTETTTFTVTVDDGIAAPTVDGTTTVISTSVNDASSVAGIVAGQAVTDKTTLDPFSGVTIGDVDNPAQTLTVDVQLDLAAKGVITNLSGFTDLGGGLYRFSGTAAAATTAIQALTFDPAENRVAPSSTETTTFTISVDDGIAAPTVDATTTVISTSVNDGSTVGGTVASQAVTDKTTVDPFSGVTVGDLDNPAQTLTVDVQLDLAAKGLLTNLSGFTDLGGGLYRFSGTAAAATTAIQALTFDPAENRVAPGSTETTTFTISVDDGIAAPTVDATTTVISTSVNDASTVGGTVAGQAVTDKTTVDPFSGVSIGDLDNPAQTLTVDVQLDLAAKGALTNLSGFTDLGGGLYRFSGTAAAATTAIQALSFDPAENRDAPGSTETTTFTISVDDGIAAPTVDATTTVLSTSVNDASTVGGAVAGQAVTDKTTVDPFSGVTIGDLDNPAQTLTVDVQLDLAAKGTLTNLSGFTDLGGGLYRFSGTATAATTAIQALTFDPAENRVAPGLTETTTFTISVDDGIAAPSVDATTTVISTSVNDASTVAGAVAGQAVTDKTTVAPFTGVTIGDVDNPAQTLTVDVQLDLAAKGILTNLSGFTDLGGGLYRYSGTAAAATTAIQALTFDPAENRVTPGLTETTTFTISVDDGIAAPTVDATTTVISTSVNDASTLGGTVAGQAVTDKTTVDPFSGVTIGDVDNPAQTLTVDVQLDLAAKGTLTNLSGFTDLGGGLYRFSGTATAATTAIQALTFDPAENRVAPGLTETTTFTISVDDGIAAPSVDATTTVISTSVNDASTVAGAVAGQAVTDKGTVDPFSAVTIGDVDNPAQTLSVDVQVDLAAKGVLINLSGFTDLGGGLYRFSGTAASATTAIRALTFDPTENRVAPGLTETTTFTITVDDGMAPPTVDATTTVVSTSINDAPTLSGTVAGQVVTDKATVDPFTVVNLTEPDVGQTMTVDVQLDLAAKGVLTNLGGFTHLGGGLYRFMGTPALAMAALQGLSFDPAENRVAPGLTETTSFTITVDDALAAPAVDATTSVISTSINDAPSVANRTFSVPVSSANGSVVGSVPALDPDAGESLLWTITGGNTGGAFLIDPASGQIRVADASALGSGPFTLSVRVDDANGAAGTATVSVGVSGTTTDPDPDPVPVVPPPTPDPVPAPEPVEPPEPAEEPALEVETETPEPIPAAPTAPAAESHDRFVDLAALPDAPASAISLALASAGPDRTPPVSAPAPAPALAARPEPAPLVIDDAMWQALAAMNDEMSEAAEEPGLDFLVDSAQAASLVTSAGLLTWLLRAGTMAGSLLSTLPLWGRVDPLAVLEADSEQRRRRAAAAGDDEDEDEDREVAAVIDGEPPTDPALPSGP